MVRFPALNALIISCEVSYQDPLLQSIPSIFREILNSKNSKIFRDLHCLNKMVPPMNLPRRPYLADLLANISQSK
jgi:hypothetical protein